MLSEGKAFSLCWNTSMAGLEQADVFYLNTEPTSVLLQDYNVCRTMKTCGITVSLSSAQLKLVVPCANYYVIDAICTYTQTLINRRIHLSPSKLYNNMYHA